MAKSRKLMWIVIVQIVIIFCLLGYIYWGYESKELRTERYGLLSPRISSGLLAPQSYLILNFKPLEDGIRNYIYENNLNVSVYVLNLRDGASFGINEDNNFDPVSLHKLPLAVAILKKVEEGVYSLDNNFSITEQDRDSKFGDLYLRNTSSLPLRELVRLMLSESDNTAFNVINDQLTKKDIIQVASYLNYYDTNINYQEAFADNIFLVSSKSTTNLFSSLYLSTILQPEYSQLILSDLSNNTSFNLGKYASLPENVTLAHKDGDYFVGKNNLFHDCGIIYIQDSRIAYCIMSSGLNEESAKTATGQIVGSIYSYVSSIRRVQSEGLSVYG